MEAGYEGFSMGLLSKRAGVAKGTLYLYFGTKEEVLLSLYSQEFERFCTLLSWASLRASQMLILYRICMRPAYWTRFSWHCTPDWVP